jgi:hypothetical protein
LGGTLGASGGGLPFWDPWSESTSGRSVPPEKAEGLLRYCAVGREMFVWHIGSSGTSSSISMAEACLHLVHRPSWCRLAGEQYLLLRSDSDIMSTIYMNSSAVQSSSAVGWQSLPFIASMIPHPIPDSSSVRKSSLLIICP